MVTKTLNDLEGEGGGGRARRLAFSMVREAYEALRDRRDAADHIRHLSLQQFVEFLVAHASFEEEALRKFQPTTRKHGRPRGTSVGSNTRRRLTTVSEEQPIGSSEAESEKHWPDPKDGYDRI